MNLFILQAVKTRYFQGFAELFEPVRKG